MNKVKNNTFYYYYYYNFIFFNTLIYFNWLFIILTLLGISFIDSYYTSLLSFIIRTYVCIFLITRFNPIINFIPNRNFSKLDKKVAFTAGLTIILSDANLINYIKDLIKKFYLTTKTTLLKK